MRYLFLLCTSFIFCFQLNSQCDDSFALACNDGINITLDKDCGFPLNPDYFLEDPQSTDYVIELIGPNGPITNTQPFPASLIGIELDYKIHCGNNSCWGSFTVEVKTPPVIESVECLYVPGETNPEDVTCEILCGGDPWNFLLSADEIESLYGSCYAGSLDARIESMGDLCTNTGSGFNVSTGSGSSVTPLGTGSGVGIFHTVTWVYEYEVHGEQFWQELVTQAYWERPVSAQWVSCPADDSFMDLPLSDVIIGTLTGSGVNVGGLDINTGSGVPDIINNWITTEGELTWECSWGSYEPEDIKDLFDDPKTTPSNTDDKLSHYCEGIIFAYPWFPVDVNGNGEFDNWGEFIPITNDGPVCNLLSSYSDTEFALCGSTKKVLRQWTVLDWCQGDIFTCEQLIRIVDTKGPEFSDIPELPVYANIQPWTCIAELVIPPLEHGISDNCGSYSMEVSIGGSTYDVGDVVTLEEGTHTLTYVAVDECGNGGSTTKDVIVIDNTPPTPVCEDELVVTLTPDDIVGEGGGVGKIFADAFDAGSHDGGCGPTWVKVIRMDNLNGTRHGYWNLNNGGALPLYNQAPDHNPSDVCGGADGDDYADCKYDDGKDELETDTGTQIFFDDFVKFCCSDVDNEEIMVVVRVFDQDPGAGPVQPWRMDQDSPFNGILAEQFGRTELCSGDALDNDLAGHYNDCMVRVSVQLKYPTVITCPPDVGVDCTEDVDPALNPSVGVATGTGLCSDPCIAWYDVADDVGGNNPSCGSRIIYRSFFVDADCDGVQGPLEELTEQCHQLIFVSDSDQFDPGSIKWPMHYTGTSFAGVSRECASNGVDVIEEPDNVSDYGHFDCVTTETCEPEWTDPGCGLVGSTLSQDTVYFEDDACVKILNHWTVIDWCLWEPNTGDDIDSDDSREGDPAILEIKGADIGSIDFAVSTSIGDDTPYTGTIVLADPNEACTAIVNGGAISGKVALIDRGNCPFVDKVMNAQNAGAIAAIVCNNLPDSDLVNMSGSDPSLTIPSIFISYEDCLRIKIALEGGADVSACYTLATDAPPVGDDDYTNSFDEIEAVSDWAQGNCEKDGCANRYFRYLREEVDTDGDGELDAIVPVVDVDGYYDFVQVIKVINTTAPEMEACEDIVVPALANCEGELIISNGASDAENCASDWLKWNVEVFDVAWEVVAGYTVTSGNGEKLTINVSDDIGNVGPGTYRVRWTVSDGCNNSTSCIQYYTVEDKKAPTPYCIESLSTAVMDGAGSVTIWASDFDRGSFDNCTASEDLKFSFSCDSYEPSATFTCEDLTNGVSEDITLQMCVWDEAGNTDFCTVTLRIDDNADACEDQGTGMAAIHGTITTEGGEPIEEVLVEVGSIRGEYPKNDMTAEDGEYDFNNNPLSYDYSITPSKDGDDLNGVSTLDLVLIQKHILGVEVLESPYKLIAADVNNDQRVSAVDLVELRKLILGIYSEYPNNSSWRFVDARQLMISPWPFTEVLEIDNLASNMMAEDFIGIKIGDVNGTAVANNLMNVESRSRGSIKMTATDANVVTGQEVTVSFTGSEFNNVYGYQFTMDHAGLDLVSVSGGTLDITRDNVGVRSGRLTMSWNSTEGVSSAGELFSLTFKATNGVQLSDAIRLNSTVTPVEAYVGSEYTQSDIEMIFNGTSATSDFALYQNEPNPFESETIIGFDLPTAGKATLTIMETTGKVVRIVKGDYSRGYNEVIVQRNTISTSGVLLYQLESGEYTATKKMIVIE